ncbi:unnamed protein product [Rotaria magnacalcarata]|uniref:G-protein coupled receptors family 1 profile domain-containing protein n=1 Tax=Rotaria magnacalcarata TaxID=392030 RepID=A0A816LXW8_9BILA|nr:unnamed protein product [Rotaria magnacalcarata]CAF3998562.1 unnamed protein product [Rotaria magnacalcarata]
MSSPTTTVDILDSVIRYLNISVGLFLFVFGITGNLLNIVIFSSLKTFRRNPCAFCLLILSCCEIGTLIGNTLVDVFASTLSDTFDVNAILPCKIRTAFGQIFATISLSMMCFAAIDQSISTSMPERHHGINLKIMRRLIAIITVISCVHAIPFFIFYDIQPLSGTNDTICRIKDASEVFSKYLIYINIPLVNGVIPVTIMILFGVLSYRNVHRMYKRRVHIVRLRLEKQLTAMVLAKIFSFAITVIPFLIVYIIRYSISLYINDPICQNQILLAQRVFILLIYANYADSFYIFLACSARFRRQLKFVIFDVYLKHYRAKSNINRVQPIERSFGLTIDSGIEHK